MKLTELKPCNGCGGPLTGSSNSIVFYVITVDQAVIKPHAVRNTMNLANLLGSLQLAEVMGPEQSPVELLSAHGAPKTTLNLCFDCYTGIRKTIHLAEIVEGINQETEKMQSAGSFPNSNNDQDQNQG